MFSFNERIDPTDDFHVVCTHLMGLFYGTDVKVEIMDSPHQSCDWILVYLKGTEDECIQLSKKLRRLARGKPRFTLSRRNISEDGETPLDRLVALISATSDHSQ